MRQILFIILTCVAIGTSGCATGRLADLRDCGKLSVGAGLGLGADVGIGSLAHPSVGIMAKTYRVGSESRNECGTWQEGEIYFPVVLFPSLIIYKSPWACSYSRTSWDWSQHTLADRSDKWVNFHPKRNPDESTFYRSTDIEVGATLGFVSVRVGINPLEICDCFLGLFGFDIAHDDIISEQKYQNRYIGP